MAAKRVKSSLPEHFRQNRQKFRTKFPHLTINQLNTAKLFLKVRIPFSPQKESLSSITGAGRELFYRRFRETDQYKHALTKYRLKATAISTIDTASATFMLTSS